jgi:hypothetical protein
MISFCALHVFLRPTVAPGAQPAHGGSSRYQYIGERVGHAPKSCLRTDPIIMDRIGDFML